MAARIPRLARLTLYSGPNCSLCDIAKAELAKVRQTHQFDLEVVNIQDKGQEKEGDSQGALERIKCVGSPGEVGSCAGGQGGPSRIDAAVEGHSGFLEFFVDDAITDGWGNWPSQACYYDRDTPVVLGERPATASDIWEPDIRHCFNCGSPDHAVASCPSPLDRQLISLSRQLFNFLHPSRGVREPERFHAVEAWKQQRLEWLDQFRPGRV
ncbi:hypothetical protein BV22DRAFT_970296, partial [Leucogyrophana mollusca]